MNSLRRFAMLVVALAMLGATGAVSQDAVLLQYRMTEDTVRAMDVVSNQTGAAAGESQAIDATITVLSRARNVDDEGFTEDLYTVDTWIRIESAGEVLDTSEEGSELTGTGITGNRPVTTYRLDWHGRSLGGDDVPTADDPMAKLTNALQSAMGRLPSEPVAPGATWTDATSAEVGEGSAEVTVEWRFDRLAEIDGRQYAILKAEARAVCQNVDAGRKEQRIQIQGMDLHQYIDEYVENLSVAQTVEVQWDIEAGYGVKTIVDQVIQATSLITLTDADTGQVQVAGISVEVERTGKVSITTRPPTDDELARMAPEAAAESIARRDLSLFETLLAPGYDAAELTQSFESDFAAYEALSATASDVTVTLDGATGTVAFTLSVEGAKAQVGPGEDVAALEPLYEAPVTLSLTKTGGLWLIDGVSVGAV